MKLWCSKLLFGLLLLLLIFTPSVYFLKAQEVPKNTNQPSIVGGNEVYPRDKYSGVVSIGTAGVSDDLNAHGCMGSLIHPRWVLTAAHCLFDLDGRLRDKSFFQVVIGKYNLQESGGEKFSVRDMFLYNFNGEQFNWNTASNDVALILLNGSSRFPTMPLADISESAYIYETILGWGMTKESMQDKSPALKEVSLPMVDNAICNKYFQDTNQRWRASSKSSCSGYPTNSFTPCFTDSGGPHVIQRADSNLWSQVGVTSFIATNNGGCNSYNVSSKLTFYIDWLQFTLHNYGDDVHFVGNCTSFNLLDSVISYEHPDCKGRYDSLGAGGVTRPFRFDPAAFYIGSNRSVLLKDLTGANHLCATRSLFNVRKDSFRPNAGVPVWQNVGSFTVYLDNTCGGKDTNKIYHSQKKLEFTQMSNTKFLLTRVILQPMPSSTTRGSNYILNLEVQNNTNNILSLLYF